MASALKYWSISGFKKVLDVALGVIVSDTAAGVFQACWPGIVGAINVGFASMRNGWIGPNRHGRNSGSFSRDWSPHLGRIQGLRRAAAHQWERLRIRSDGQSGQGVRRRAQLWRFAQGKGFSIVQVSGVSRSLSDGEASGLRILIRSRTPVTPNTAPLRRLYNCRCVRGVSLDDSFVQRTGWRVYRRNLSTASVRAGHGTGAGEHALHDRLHQIQRALQQHVVLA